MSPLRPSGRGAMAPPSRTYICRHKPCGIPCIREYTEPPAGCPYGYCSDPDWYELVPVRGRAA